MGINLTFPKLPNHTPLFKSPITTTAPLETNPSSQSLSKLPKINENNLYIVRYIYFFTITNLELLTIRDFKLHNTHLFLLMFLPALFPYFYFKIFNLGKKSERNPSKHQNVCSPYQHQNKDLPTRQPHLPG